MTMDWISLIFRGPGLDFQVDGLRSACRSAARRHAEEVEDLSRRMEDVEAWIGELTLLNQTLLRLLLARGAFTKEHFQAVFRELDLMDGVKDGKLRRKGAPGQDPRAGPSAREPSHEPAESVHATRRIRRRRRR
jgi:hypothetical protein